MNQKSRLLCAGLGCMVLVGCMACLRVHLSATFRKAPTAGDYYQKLEPGPDPQHALDHMRSDFTVDMGFSSNLPLVVLHLNAPLPEYKTFSDGPDGFRETVYEDAAPWVDGVMQLYDREDGENLLTDQPVLTSSISIKKRGHTSILFDKPQYYIKTVTPDGQGNPVDLFGMGNGEAWVLNGSMADKSMLRNYLAYRVSAGIMDYAPRCRYCEVFLQEEDGTYTYQGVYLMIEAVKRGENRVNIDASRKKNVYTSYLVRRDRFTVFDTMLDTYGRLNGLDPEWIGVKYPSDARQTPENLAYIAQDFSRIEQVLYSRDPDVYNTYSRYLDVDSFVDYFLINEYFGNYDAGEHSTYMYKSSGERLKIGPVWDFDQAMNNSVMDETDPLTMAMQDRAFFRELVRDTTFLDALCARYAQLRRTCLSDSNLFSLIDETSAFLSAAGRREWYRWAEDYLDGSKTNPHNFYLNDYMMDGITINRFNDDYQQELYTIRLYLSRHGRAIPLELKKLYDSADATTGLRAENELFLLLVFILFLLPSIAVNRWR